MDVPRSTRRDHPGNRFKSVLPFQFAAGKA